MQWSILNSHHHCYYYRCCPNLIPTLALKVLSQAASWGISLHHLSCLSPVFSKFSSLIALSSQHRSVLSQLKNLLPLHWFLSPSHLQHFPLLYTKFSESYSEPAVFTFFLNMKPLHSGLFTAETNFQKLLIMSQVSNLMGAFWFLLYLNPQKHWNCKKLLLYRHSLLFPPSSSPSSSLSS